MLSRARRYCRLRAYKLFGSKELKKAKLWMALCRLLGTPDSWLFDLDARICFISGHFEEALGKFRSAVEADSTNAEPRRGLAICLARMGKSDEATEIAKHLLIVGGIDATFCDEFGYELITHGSPHSEALPWFELANRLNPCNEGTRLSMAHCQLNLQDASGALSTYRDLAEHSNDNWTKVEARIGWAKALYDLGRLSEAVEVTKALLAYKNESLSVSDWEQISTHVAWLESETGTRIE